MTLHCKKVPVKLNDTVGINALERLETLALIRASNYCSRAIQR